MARPMVALAAALLAIIVAPAGAAGCADWPEYGRTAARTFDVECAASPITTASVGRLVTDWSYKTRRAVTASPAVVGGVVYAGDWSGTMYALRAGRLVWEHSVAPAPGATFGPIVSSAAVADVG